MESELSAGCDEGTDVPPMESFTGGKDVSRQNSCYSEGFVDCNSISESLNKDLFISSSSDSEKESEYSDCYSTISSDDNWKTSDNFGLQLNSGLIQGNIKEEQPMDLSVRKIQLLDPLNVVYSGLPNSGLLSPDFLYSELPNSAFRNSAFPNAVLLNSNLPNSDLPKSDWSNSELSHSEWACLPNSELFNPRFPKSDLLNSEQPSSHLPDVEDSEVKQSEESLVFPISGSTSVGRRRKKKPIRSLQRFNPKFRGVTFVMNARLLKDQAVLDISSDFILSSMKRERFCRRSVTGCTSSPESPSGSDATESMNSDNVIRYTRFYSSANDQVKDDLQSSSDSTVSAGSNSDTGDGGVDVNVGSGESGASSNIGSTSDGMFAVDNVTCSCSYCTRLTSGEKTDSNTFSGPAWRKISNTLGKQCASCGTLKTPLWRDAEDGTPLCNACGIRYKKYRVRCGRCWRIPKKNSKWTWLCASCGYSLRTIPLINNKSTSAIQN